MSANKRIYNVRHLAQCAQNKYLTRMDLMNKLQKCKRNLHTFLTSLWYLCSGLIRSIGRERHAWRSSWDKTRILSKFSCFQITKTCVILNKNKNKVFVNLLLPVGKIRILSHAKLCNKYSPKNSPHFSVTTYCNVIRTPT